MVFACLQTNFLYFLKSLPLLRIDEFLSDSIQEFKLAFNLNFFTPAKQINDLT